VCEKLTIFPYAECTVEFCARVAFLWYSQVQDRIRGCREIHVQKCNKTTQNGDTPVLRIAMAKQSCCCGTAYTGIWTHTPRCCCGAVDAR